MATLTIADAERLVTHALAISKTSAENARSTARALVAAEADGQPGHGLSRVPSYCKQALNGKVDGCAKPVVHVAAAAALIVDAQSGFAYPAIDYVIEQLPAMARHSGVAIAAIRRSHHFGQAGAHVERLANSGLVAIAFANSPKAMAFWGGKTAMMGTNPVAFAAPMPNTPPLVIDMALSVAARAKIIKAQKDGRPIPADWAIDAGGQPTTDPASALAGSLMPIGGAKGSALALMVEILAAAVTGCNFGWEANSVLDDKGAAPNLGHLIVALDANLLSMGTFTERMGGILTAIAADPAVRVPGSRRLKSREKATRMGLEVAGDLLAEIEALAGREIDRQ
ncbi:MAG: Ldh family oxidoreductase [Rhodobacteraceae bacterium]|nr:Ldh family oxidoreductase [Paracoccaceae bacterium]